MTRVGTLEAGGLIIALVSCLPRRLHFRTMVQTAEGREIAKAAAKVRQLQLEAHAVSGLIAAESGANDAERAAALRRRQAELASAINSAEMRVCSLRLSQCEREFQQWTAEKDRAEKTVRTAQEKLRDAQVLIGDYGRRLRILATNCQGRQLNSGRGG